MTDMVTQKFNEIPKEIIYRSHNLDRFNMNGMVLQPSSKRNKKMSEIGFKCVVLLSECMNLGL